MIKYDDKGLVIGDFELVIEDDCVRLVADCVFPHELKIDDLRVMVQFLNKEIVRLEK